MGKQKSNPAQNVINEAKTQYQSTLQPSANETQMSNFTGGMGANYNNAVQRNTADYGNIMGQYQNFGANLGGPSNFSYRNVSAATPKELTESYGYLRGAMPGYQEFANTGGYSAGDIRDLRARGISPIRSMYGNTMMELDRARALGGAGGAPNYIAARSRAQRELPGQLADAMTNVNAGLAESVRQGKEFGLSGETQTGATMGGLSSADAQRQLQASLSNQQADLQTQAMHEQSLQALRQNQLAAMGGQASLYGTTPGMASMFGNQALQGYGLQAQMQAQRQNYGLGLMDEQMKAYSANKGQQGSSWWKKAMAAAAAGAATYFTAGAAAPAAAGIYAGLAGGAAGVGDYFAQDSQNA